MKSKKQVPTRVPPKVKILSCICIAALLYGAIAQAMPGGGGSGAGSIHPIHTDLVSKQYTYDADGNHTGTASWAGSESKEYDVLGRLTRYEGPEGVEEYTYIGASHKRRTVRRTPVGGAAPETTTFLYDGNNVIAEYVGDDLLLSRSYVTPALDENLSMTVHDGPDAGVYYYSQDGLGSVRLLTDSVGAVCNNHEYTAFGESDNVVDVDQRYGFTGRENSLLTRTMHYRHRDYSALTGRFDRRDPMGYTSNKYGNLYEYVHSRPTQFIDPYGLWNSSAHKSLTEHAMMLTGCSNACVPIMANANVGVDGGARDGVKWFFGITGSPEDAAPHYMAAVDNLGKYNRKQAAENSEALIAKLYNEALAYARNGDCVNGAVALGKALHTIQDRYSHTNSNWEPVTDPEHRNHIVDNYFPIYGVFIPGWDDPRENRERYQGALNASAQAAQEYVDTLKNEGCFQCK